MNALRENQLGDFLKASRGRASLAASCFPSVGSRRVAGLRREEVAVVAGVSADYYARIEQGRERNPSAQVIEAIARARCASASTSEATSTGSHASQQI